MTAALTIFFLPPQYSLTLLYVLLLDPLAAHYNHSIHYRTANLTLWIFSIHKRKCAWIMHLYIISYKKKKTEIMQ